MINRNGVNLSLANVHLAGHMKLGSTVGLVMSGLVDAHEAAVARMSDSIHQGFNALEASGRELGITAEFYQNHDQQSAARLDGAHPASPRPTIESPDSYRPPHLEGRAGPFATGPGTDVVDPLVFLKPPGKPHEFTDPVKLFNVVSDLISPSWWLNEIINDTIGANPLKTVTDWFVGDWEGFTRCAMVWDDLSKAVGAIGENVKSGLTWLAADWYGNSADGAVHYFDYARQALDQCRLA